MEGGFRHNYQITVEFIEVKEKDEIANDQI